MDIKAQASFFSGNIDDAEWLPFEYPQAGDLQTYGEVVPFRESASASAAARTHGRTEFLSTTC